MKGRKWQGLGSACSPVLKKQEAWHLQIPKGASLLFGCWPQVLLPLNADISSSEAGAARLGKPGLLSSSNQEYATLEFEKKNPLRSNLHFQ